MRQDVRFAVRSLARQPMFALGAIATLALGIGANSTIFTLSNAVLFRHLPGIAAPAQLVWVSSVWRDRGRQSGLSYPDYLDYREGSRELFADMMGFWPTALSLGSGGDPSRIRGHLVTGSYFPTLGVAAAEGRLIETADDRRGAQPVVVLGYRLWQRRFAGSPEIIGQSIVLNGRPFAVAGVAPEGFAGPSLGDAADVWVPIASQPDLFGDEPRRLESRASAWLMVMGRLRGGVAESAAQSALAGIAARLARAHSDADGNRTVALSGTPSALSPEGRSEMIPLAALLMIVAGLVLLIACANIANLMLARGAGRWLELGIRAAIGATRGRLIRQLLTESLVVAAVGAAAGLLTSFWATDIIIAALPAAEFQGLGASADARVLAFTAAIAIGSVLAFGLVPALAATRGALQPSLRETPSAGGRSRLQRVFVVAQLSLSLVLLLAAGLTLRALQKAGTIDLGFNPQHVVTASYDLVLQNYPAERREVFRRELMSRLETLPGVTSASSANVPPLSGTMISTLVSTTGADGRPSEARAFTNGVGPRYFATLEIPIRRGREVGAQDGPGAPGAAIVNETLARQLWDGADALGRTVTLDGDPLTVVGIARDAKYDEATEDPRPFLYLSLAQHSQLDRETAIVRTDVPSALVEAALQAQVRALDPALPVFDVRPFERALADRADKQRGISALLAAFGSLALLLAALGLYGVMAYAVATRTREMGLRLALGASPAQLMQLVAGDGLRLALTGVAAGSVLALPLAQALGTLVFGVQIADLAAFAGTCLLLVAVALLAALLPARRAARLDPIVALRTD